MPVGIIDPATYAVKHRHYVAVPDGRAAEIERFFNGRAAQIFTPHKGRRAARPT